MKYCDDVNCSNCSPGNLDGTCKLGFKNRFRVPGSMADAVYSNWGYVMPKICRIKFKQVKPRTAKALVE